MSKYTECLQIIKAAGGDKISKEQSEALLSEINDFIELKKKTLKPGESLDDAVLNVIKTKADEMVLSAAIEKRNAYINLKARVKLDRFVAKFSDPALGLKAYMGGTVRLAEKGRLSIDAQGKALQNKYLGRLINDLENHPSGDKSLFAIFDSGDLDKEIAQELWEIRPGGKPGVSNSKAARDIAEVIHKYQTMAVERQNRAGAYIKNLPGYIVRQSHDMFEIRRAGFKKWADDIIPLLDHEKTFGIDDVDKFIESAYDALSSGMHMRAKGAELESNHILGFKGPANVAKRVSQPRVLHFKDADSWSKYNDMYGSGNLRESVVFGLEHAARNSVLMEGLGTNPVANLELVKKKLSKANRKDTKKFDRLQSESITNLLKEIDGTARIPANLTAARISSSWRIVQNMAKLGQATVSSVTDIPFQVAELRYQGQPLFSSYINVIGNIFAGRRSGEKKEIARLLGLGFDGITNDILSRFSPQDTVPGMMSKMQQRFFKLNLMSWWNDSHRTGMGLIMSGHLAGQANKGFAKLDADTTRVLSLYGIKEKEWDLIRKTKHRAANGYSYITPDKIQELPDSDIVAYLGKKTATAKEIQRAKDALETQLQTYFVDRADFGVPMPGAAERAMMNRGTQPGTPLGEAVRFFWQFKSFPVTVIHRALGREIYGKGANTLLESIAKGKGDLLGLSHLMASTTLFGYLAMVIKDLAKGKEPRTMDDPKVVLAAMAQGGGMGIYGDFMFGEFSRYGRSFLSTLSGPTFGQLDDLGELWTRLRSGDDVTSNALRMTMNNTPFINLFYTRAALDYMFLYQLQEMVNPGYLRRMEGRMKRENDQRFFLPPSREIPYGGGNKPLEGIL